MIPEPAAPGLCHSRATAQTQTTPGSKQSSDMGWVEQGQWEASGSQPGVIWHLAFQERQQLSQAGRCCWPTVAKPRHSSMAGSYLVQSVHSAQVEKPWLKPSCWR